MRPRPALLLILLLCSACAAPTPKTPAKSPGPDGWELLADGELKSAEALFSRRYAKGDADALGGLIRIAHIRGDHEALGKLVARVDAALAPARTLLAAGLAAVEIPSLGASNIAHKACALYKAPRYAIRAGAICSRLALARAAKSQRRCLKGCDAATTVPMRLVGPSPVVMASINGKPPAPFVVDSGASTSVITKRYARSIGATPVAGAGYQVNSPGGLIEAERTLARLGVGGVQLADVPFAIIDLPFDSIAGLISPHDAFRAFRSRFDFRAFRFAVAPSRARDDALIALPLRIAEGNPHVWVAFGERPARPLMLDTGAVTTTFTPALEKLGKALPRRGESAVVGAGGKRARAWWTTATLPARAGALRWSCVRPRVHVPGHPGDYDAFRKFGLLGMDFLIGREVEIDVPANQIRISSQPVLAPWTVGQSVVLEILGQQSEDAPVMVLEKVVARDGERVTLEAQLVGVKEPATFRYTIRDDWSTRGTWLIARPALTFELKQKDGRWAKAPPKAATKQWLKVFSGFSAQGKNLRVRMVELARGDDRLPCTMVAMDAQTKAGPARLRSFECPSLPWRVAAMDVKSKATGKTIWGFAQRGLVLPAGAEPESTPRQQGERSSR